MENYNIIDDLRLDESLEGYFEEIVDDINVFVKEEDTDVIYVHIETILFLEDMTFEQKLDIIENLIEEYKTAIDQANEIMARKKVRMAERKKHTGWRRVASSIGRIIPRGKLEAKALGALTRAKGGDNTVATTGREKLQAAVKLTKRDLAKGRIAETWNKKFGSNPFKSKKENREDDAKATEAAMVKTMKMQGITGGKANAIVRKARAADFRRSRQDQIRRSEADRFAQGRRDIAELQRKIALRQTQNSFLRSQGIPNFKPNKFNRR